MVIACHQHSCSSYRSMNLSGSIICNELGAGAKRSSQKVEAESQICAAKRTDGGKKMQGGLLV
jgi:hypothetical protein